MGALTTTAKCIIYAGRHSWVPHPRCSRLLVPSNRVNHHHDQTAGDDSCSGDEVIHSLLSDSSDSRPGGVVDTEQKLLYARVTSIDSVDVGMQHSITIIQW